MVTISNVHYEKEFFKKIVNIHIKEGRTPSSLAKEYNVSKSTIISWIKKYYKKCEEIEQLNTDSSTNAEDELKTLRKKIFELEKENLFLKKTAAFFAKEI